MGSNKNQNSYQDSAELLLIIDNLYVAACHSPEASLRKATDLKNRAKEIIGRNIQNFNILEYQHQTALVSLERTKTEYIEVMKKQYKDYENMKIELELRDKNNTMYLNFLFVFLCIFYSFLTQAILNNTIWIPDWSKDDKITFMAHFFGGFIGLFVISLFANKTEKPPIKEASQQKE